MNKQEKDLYNALEKARAAYHHSSIDPQATIAQINAAKDGVEKILLSIKNYYLSGVKIPENISGEVMAMRKNESTVQIACSVTDNGRLIRVCATASSQREVQEKFNAGEFDRSAVTMVWQDNQLVVKKEDY